ncbi:MAG TPA: asparagine synthase (glutamine-hydrolyzing) [Stellaceae bacterium]|jgi:asparagine synthase (glutamine-hydrolysing)|nr:asparagine synthase (glutamine-hydrolyzing) [Stellaceae bacterium]
MCGINGIFAYHPAASALKESELLATRDAMRRRGPDGAGAWWSGDRRCGLAHRRLTILDLSDRAAQPMVGADGRLVVTFNGEIYNFPELRYELEADGFRFRTTSDTEALLHLYARDGAAMVHRLRGMYAFAIWDDVKRELFLARDPYGIKPLYTANDGWTFRFASQVKALLAGGAVSRDPEPAGIAGFHLFGSVPEPFTLYRDIRALPAGHTQIVDSAGPREPQQFVNLAAILAEGAAHPALSAELPQRLREAALDSVRAHLLADVEVGLFLSAGIDSGALLGLMRDTGQRDIRAITLAFDEFRGTEDDEAPLAAQVAGHYGAEHIIRRVDRREFDTDLPAILDAMDQPSIDGVNTWFVAKAAKEAGLKVALSGLGGDELLAGYSSFADLPRWRRRFGPLAAIPGIGRLARYAIPALAPGFAKARPKALGMLEYANRWAGAYLLRRGLFLPHELPGIMDPDMAREGLRRLKPLRRLAASLAPDPGSDTGRVCALESTHYMRNQLLRDADWAGMAHGIEIRVPLVDVVMLKLVARAYPALTHATGKAALAQAPVTPLPPGMVHRAKTGFVVPTRTWMNTSANTASAARRETANTRGSTSRQWSRLVLAGHGNLEARAA